MINVWFILNEHPPSNHLVFHETTQDKVLQSHMLHGNAGYLELAWCLTRECRGTLLRFRFGQSALAERILYTAQWKFPQFRTRGAGCRRSCEMRFTVHPPGALAKADVVLEQSKSKFTDDGTGSSSNLAQ